VLDANGQLYIYIYIQKHKYIVHLSIDWQPTAISLICTANLHFTRSQKPNQRTF